HVVRDCVVQLLATTRLMQRSIIRFNSSARASFRQPRFPKALNLQLMALRDPRWRPRYCKVGIDLKQTSQRLARLGIPSKMRQSGRQTTKSYRIGRVLTKSPLKKPDRLVEAAKLDQGITDASRIIMNGGAQRAHANGAFTAPDCFFVLACNLVDPSSNVPRGVKIWIGRDRSINEIDGGLVVADKHGGNQPGRA